MSYLGGVPSFPTNFYKSARARAARAKYTGRVYGTTKQPDPYSSQHVRVLHARSAGLQDQPIALGSVFSKIKKVIKKVVPKEIRKAIPKELTPGYFSQKILPKELSLSRMIQDMRKKPQPVAAASTPDATISPMPDEFFTAPPLVSQPFYLPASAFAPGSGEGGGQVATEAGTAAEANLFSAQNLMIAGALGVGTLLLLRKRKGRK
jgi:hypothetical protein